MVKRLLCICFLLALGACAREYNCRCLFQEDNSSEPREEFANFEARKIDAESICYASIQDTTGLIRCELID